MKINISIEATAQEMREFLGLPNVQPLHDEMLEIIRKNMNKGVAEFDPLTLMKPLLPPQIQSMETFQKAFWDAFANTGQGTAKESTRETANEPNTKKK